MKNRLGWGFGLLVAVAGCGGPTEEPVDSGIVRDTGPTIDANADVGPPVDTGVPVDTGTVPDDTGTADDTGIAVDAFVGTDAAVVTTGCELTGYPALDGQMLRASGDLVTALEVAPGRDDIFIAERDGRIRIMDPVTGTVAAGAFLDINSLTGSGSGGDERGLLGLAFHPDFATNGLFYVDYTPHSGTAENRVAVGHVSAGSPDVADATVTTILAVPDFASNHNGGQLAFGPDGYLYVAMGDGGLGGDPMENGQDINELLGKILRLDVSATAYTSPATNPFAGATAGRDEIWAYGVRNPWRFSFDRLTGDMFIADVGQGTWEEIDFVAAGTGAGDNYGWNVCEGNHSFGGGACSSLAGHHAPIYEYRHGGSADIQGVSITGGYVYRGSAIPLLNGAYVFGDASNGMVAALRYCEGTVRDATLLDGLNGLCNVTTFGEDANGEILMGCFNGEIFRVTPG